MDNELLVKEMKSLVEGNEYKITILANASALIYNRIKDLNWAGFYLLKKDKLILGPFQGNTACIEIPLIKGVCGACATTKKTIVVENVHEFKGHIACDSASNSEICVPLFVNQKLYGLLDIDSPVLNRFEAKDVSLIEAYAKALEKALETAF